MKHVGDIVWLLETKITSLSRQIYNYKEHNKIRDKLVKQLLKLLVFSTTAYCKDLMQWNLSIKDTLGPTIFTCYTEVFLF